MPDLLPPGSTVFGGPPSEQSALKMWYIIRLVYEAIRWTAYIYGLKVLGSAVIDGMSLYLP